MNDLRIDHVNAMLGGGAAIAARRVHEGLLDVGFDSRFWYARGGDPPHASYARWPDSNGARGWIQTAANKLQRIWQRKKMKRVLRGRPLHLEQFSAAQQPHRRAFNADAFQGDVLHLHWLGAEVDYSSFFASVGEKPIVWTLHDMNPFTGGCHYANGCERFGEGCGRCPQLGTPAIDDLSRTTFRIKQQALPSERIHVVAPSRWLLELAESSPLLGRAASFHLIPYGFDLQRFQPDSQQEARRRLGVSPDSRVVAFGADEVHNHRKGFVHLREALAQLADIENLECVCFGQGQPALDHSSPVFVRSLGFVRDPQQLADVYRAADVFVMPSLEDNLPQTGMESLACGTPVVAFATGGVPDYVIPGQTGELAPVGNAHRLAASIRSLFQNDARRLRMRRSARRFAETHFDPQRQSQSYAALYEQVLGRRLRQAA